MKKLFLVILLLNSLLYVVIAQEGQTQQFYYKDEFSVGVYVYNSGWGLDIRSGKFLNPKSKRIWELGYNTIKHPKEYKQESLWLSGHYYVYGKLNECYNFYYGIGKQQVLIDKNGDNTVEMKIVGSLGMSMALLKPIYYEVYNPIDSNYIYERYSSSHQPATILAKAPFTMGLFEIKPVFGIYSKLAFNVDFASSYTSLSAIEIGLKASYYFKKLDIMAEVKNYNFFMALFLSYRFGKIYEGKRRQVIFN